MNCNYISDVTGLCVHKPSRYPQLLDKLVIEREGLHTVLHHKMKSSDAKPFHLLIFAYFHLQKYARIKLFL